MNDALALAAFWTGLATGVAGFCALVGANQSVTRLTQKLDGERAARRVVEAALRAEQRAHTRSPECDPTPARSLFVDSPAAQRITNLLAANEAGRFDPDAQDWSA